MVVSHAQRYARGGAMRQVILAPKPGLDLRDQYGHHQSPAICAGGLIFCSGMVAINPETGEREHGTGDHRATGYVTLRPGGNDGPTKRLLFSGANTGSTSETTRGRNRRSFSCTGSRTTYTSTTVCLLTSRRRAGSCYLIFSGGAVRISRRATLTPPTIKSVTSTPSSPDWGWGKSSSLRTTPRAHRPSTGHWLTPSARPGWCC